MPQSRPLSRPLSLAQSVPLSGVSGTVAVPLVTLTWSAPADANAPTLTGYRVYKSTDGGTTYSLLDTVGAVETADVSAVADDKVYVAAYNAAGDSDASNIVTIT